MMSVSDATRAAHENAKSTPLFNDRTGKLRASIEGFDTGAFTGKVHAGTPYATFMENGTRPHVILPRNGPFLIFQINGATIFARKVNHPGTKKRPFMATAKARGTTVFILSAHDRMREALR